MPILTDKLIEKTKPGPARIEIPDTLLTGLHLIIQPSGVKSFCVRYRINGERRKLTLGSYSVIGLGDAREAARVALRAVIEGRDPAAERIEARRLKDTGLTTADLIETVWSDYEARHVAKLRPNSAGAIRRLFTNHVLPAWRGRKVTEIGKRDVLSLIDDAAEKRGPAAANKTKTLLGGFFAWCLARDLINVSPCNGVARPHAEKSRERVLSDDEVRTVWIAAGEQPIFGPMVRLLVLTGARRNEVADMRRSELDLTNRIWTIPATRTKNHREHRVYLSDAALAVLDSVHHTSDEFVFSTNGDSPVSGFSKFKAKLDKSLEGVAAWGLHDLRRTCATGMAKCGVALATVEKALNHVSGSHGGIVSTYQRHAYSEETKAALIAWGGYVTALIEGAPANVVPLRRA
jgi:integrase